LSGNEIKSQLGEIKQCAVKVTLEALEKTAIYEKSGRFLSGWSSVVTS
jgi:hypothetical protein